MGSSVVPEEVLWIKATAIYCIKDLSSSLAVTLQSAYSDIFRAPALWRLICQRSSWNLWGNFSFILYILCSPHYRSFPVTVLLITLALWPFLDDTTRIVFIRLGWSSLRYLLKRAGGFFFEQLSLGRGRGTDHFVRVICSSNVIVLLRRATLFCETR